MNELLAMVGSGALCLTIGLWLLLPRGVAWGRALGALFVAASVGLLAASVPRLGAWVADSAFFVLSGVTILGAVATITFRNPVYSAIWFGLSLLGTAGLFLFQGAQFLGVATVVVYAGAILVTFLFVLMLAQPKGDAVYDRMSWAAALAALTGGLTVGILTLTVVSLFRQASGTQIETVVLENDILSTDHVARLGASLFSKQLAAVEVGGTLLLAALVGTVAIVAQIRRPDRSGEPSA